MEPHLFGRKLGIGLRVASRMVKEKTASSSARAVSRPTTATFESGGKAISQKSKKVAEGGRRFGKAVFGPFAHVASVLGLQITGVFFALFAVFALQSLWKVRAAYAGGPDHRKFLVYSVVSLVFCYFCISSFVRARWKEKRKK